MADMRRPSFAFAALFSVFAVAACTGEEDVQNGDQNFSSNQATLLDFEFDGSMIVDFSWDDEQTIESQLLYTMGHLNAQNSVGRLDTVKLTNVKKTDAPNDKVELSYHAKLPVAWGSKTNLPTSYTFRLPKDMTLAGRKRFANAHKTTCVDWSAHDVDETSMWYYYRPEKAGCQIPASDLIVAPATVTKSPENTTGIFPEYHKVWEDDRLEVISIFGKYEETGNYNDSGVWAFNQFVRNMQAQFMGQQLKVTPANISTTPGPDLKDVTIEATLADGKTVKVTALLVDAITSTWPGFDERYESLTPTADLIAYNGHAGLGQNVRELATKGKWVAGKYQMFFMNGCDTFAYVDGSLAETRSVLNPDDPTGTKYMEFVTNAMPSYFNRMAQGTTEIVNGLLSYGTPKTYDKMFENIDRQEVVLVTGEEDNVFRPGMKIGTR
jgi:hypothetical protein